MKKILMAGIAALASVAMAEGLSLADASSDIKAAVADPAKMTSTMKQLKAEDQATFLARVNATIAEMPADGAEKSALYLNANSAALKGAAKGNLSALLAEVFATVPPEDLTLINERFAEDLFNRSADASKTYTDAQFVDAAKSAMETIEKRTASADNASVRDTFAILMFLRASNGTPADLADTLVAGLPAKDQAIARNDWIPPALVDRNYEPMLGASDAGEQPEIPEALRLAGPQVSVALLADLYSGDAAGMPRTASLFSSGFDGIPVLGDDSGLSTIPRTMDKGAKNYGGYRRGDDVREPEGYNGQWIRY